MSYPHRVPGKANLIELKHIQEVTKGEFGDGGREMVLSGWYSTTREKQCVGAVVLGDDYWQKRTLHFKMLEKTKQLGVFTRKKDHKCFNMTRGDLHVGNMLFIYMNLFYVFNALLGKLRIPSTV